MSNIGRVGSTHLLPTFKNALYTQEDYLPYFNILYGIYLVLAHILRLGHIFVRQLICLVGTLTLIMEITCAHIYLLNFLYHIFLSKDVYMGL